MLARIAAPSAGTCSAPSVCGSEDQLQHRPEEDPLEQPVEQVQTSSRPVTVRRQHRRRGLPAKSAPAHENTRAHPSRRHRGVRPFPGRSERGPPLGLRSHLITSSSPDTPEPALPPDRQPDSSLDPSRRPHPPTPRPAPSRSSPTPFPTPGTGSGSGCCCVQGFTGSPASMTPWGRYLAEQGFGRRRTPPARARHDLAGAQPHPLAGLVRRGRPGLREAARQPRPGGRRRPVDGRRARRCGSPRTGAATSPGVVAGQPRRQHRAQGRPRAAGAQARRAVLPGHRQRHQEGRASRSTATPAPRCKAAHSMMQAWKPLRDGPAQGHPAAADVPLARWTTSSTPRRRRSSGRAVSSRDLTERHA